MKQYFLFAVLSLSIIVFAMAFVKKETAYPDKHLEIVLRTIGHEVLLHAGDSTSGILPVKKVNDNIYQISFQNSFGFMPDSLMSIVNRQLAKTDQSSDYTVSVNECDRHQTIFAYEINSTSGDLNPCRGREQKRGCYVIEISFPIKRSFNYGWLLAIIPVGFAGFYFARKRNRTSAPTDLSEEKVDESMPVETAPIPHITDHRQVGDFVFTESKGNLNHNGETIELSAKEAKALSILLSNQNEIVERDLLMKEIWENDGVVVIPRNVDVLISKLRKKLIGDPSIKIVNVHGKGYKITM